MPPAKRSVEEIVQSVLSREALHNPRMRGMIAVIAGAAACISLLVVADFYRWPSPLSFEAVGVPGAPYRILLVVAVLLEGLLVIDRLRRHDEPPYPTQTQAAAVTVAAVGVVLVGLGIVMLIVWTSGLQGHFPDFWQIAETYYLLMLVGSSLLLSALPVIGPTLVKPMVAETP